MGFKLAMPAFQNQEETVVPWRTQMLSPVQPNVAAIKPKYSLPLFITHTSQHSNTLLEDSNDVVNTFMQKIIGNTR